MLPEKVSDVFWNQVWLRTHSLQTLTQSYTYLKTDVACLLAYSNYRNHNLMLFPKSAVPPFRLPPPSNKVKVVPHKFKLKSIWCVFERKTGSPTQSVLICHCRIIQLARLLHILLSLFSKCNPFGLKQVFSICNALPKTDYHRQRSQSLFIFCRLKKKNSNQNLSTY